MSTSKSRYLKRFLAVTSLAGVTTIALVVAGIVVHTLMYLAMYLVFFSAIGAK
jgi:hypothetical protein